MKCRCSGRLLLQFVEEDVFFEEPPTHTHDGISVNGWAQHEIDMICETPDDLYKRGDLQLLVNIHKLNEEEIADKFPMPKASGGGHSGPKDEYMRALEEALSSNGKFNLHGGIVGNMWAKI